MSLSGPDEPHLLVVDDDERLRALLQRYLSANGFRISAACDAAEARALMKSMAFDALVLDVMMPGLDGLGALRQLKEHPATRDIPVVVLSAKGHALTRVEAEVAGAALFLAKPFSPNQLLGEVQKIIGQIKP